VKKLQVYSIDMSPSEEKIQAFFKGIGNKWFKEGQKNTKYENTNN
jgi:hypothetical protein